MSITIGGLTFQLSDFVGSNGLGHTKTQSATTGTGGEDYPEETLFPDRVYRAMQFELSQGYTPTIVQVTDATKTLALSDRNTIQECNRGTSQTITIPLNATVAYDVGTVIVFEQIGAGAVSVNGDTGVTVNGSSGGGVTISAQYLSCYLRKIATDTWIAVGSLT